MQQHYLNVENNMHNGKMYYVWCISSSGGREVRQVPVRCGTGGLIRQIVIYIYIYMSA